MLHFHSSGCNIYMQMYGFLAMLIGFTERVGFVVVYHQVHATCLPYLAVSEKVV